MVFICDSRLCIFQQEIPQLPQNRDFSRWGATWGLYYDFLSPYHLGGRIVTSAGLRVCFLYLPDGRNPKRTIIRGGINSMLIVRPRVAYDI